MLRNSLSFGLHVKQEVIDELMDEGRRRGDAACRRCLSTTGRAITRAWLLRSLLMRTLRVHRTSKDQLVAGSAARSARTATTSCEACCRRSRCTTSSPCSEVGDLGLTLEVIGDDALAR